MEETEVKLHGKYGKGKTALVDGDYDGEYFSQFRWYLNKAGYVVRAIYLGNRRTTYSYLHNEVASPPPGLWCDHINRDKLDNRTANLRWCTPSQNAVNRSTAVPNSTGYKGVMKRGRRYFAVVGKKVVAGSGRDTPAEAHQVYLDKAKERYGAFFSS